MSTHTESFETTAIFIQDKKLKKQGIGFLKWIVLQHAFPPKLFLDSIGVIWLLYFLWHHSFWTGVLVTLFFGVVGSLTTIGLDLAQIAETDFGRFIQKILHPANFILHLLGYIIIAYGVWQQENGLVLTGVSSVLLGCCWGWREALNTD